MPKKTNRTSENIAKSGAPSLPPIRRLLVPVDFSDFSLNALRYAVEFAIKLRASLIVVHVVPADYGWLGIGRKAFREYDQTLQSQAAERLRALAEMYIPKDVVADLEVRLGRPAQEIVAAAAESNSDLILLSTHGHTGLDRYLIGSVADQVARLAPCPVFLLRSGKPRPSPRRIAPRTLRFRHRTKQSRPDRRISKQ